MTSRIGSGDKCIGFACFNHHHTEVVAVKHHLKGFGIGHSVTLTLFGEIHSVTGTAVGLTVVTQIHDLESGDVDTESGGTLFNHLLVTKQDRYADTVLISVYGSAKHVVGISLGKYDTLGIALSLLGEATHELVVVAHELTELVVISIPVGDGTTSHARLHGSACNCGSNRCDESGVKRLGKYIFASETQI